MSDLIYGRLLQLHQKTPRNLPGEYTLIAAYVYGKYDVGATAALEILSKFHHLAKDRPEIEAAHTQDIVRNLLLGNFRGAKITVDIVEEQLQKRVKFSAPEPAPQAEPIYIKQNPKPIVHPVRDSFFGDVTPDHFARCAHCSESISDAAINLSCDCTFHIACLHSQLRLQLHTHQKVACPRDNRPISDADLLKLPRDKYEELRRFGYNVKVAEEPTRAVAKISNAWVDTGDLSCTVCDETMQNEIESGLDCHIMHTSCLAKILQEQFKQKELFRCPFDGHEISSKLYTQLLPPRLVNLYDTRLTVGALSENEKWVCPQCHEASIKDEDCWKKPCPFCSYSTTILEDRALVKRGGH